MKDLIKAEIKGNLRTRHDEFILYQEGKMSLGKLLDTLADELMTYMDVRLKKMEKQEAREG